MRLGAFFGAAVVGLASFGAVTVAQGPSAPFKQTGYLKASNPDAYDHFGEGGALPSHTGNTTAVSRDGSTIAVGAPHEASTASGVNGNQGDNSTDESGAVYVLAR